MSNPLSELLIESDENNLNLQAPNLNNSNKISNSFIDTKCDELYQHYFFLCKYCERFLTLNITEKGKISYICRCECKYKDLSIEEIYEHLFFSKDIESEKEMLKCYKHEDKYSYCCKKCESSFCIKCSKNCKEHENELVMFGMDDKDTKEKIEYINKKINNKENIKTDEINIPINSQNNIENDGVNDGIDIDGMVLENTDNINNENNNKNNEIININYINLFKIIFNNYENFPNYHLLETISNIERFVTSYFKEYNEIDLHYEFNEEDIEDTTVKLFCKKFVNNNKENCFLIIKEKIMELNEEIDLKNIFDAIPLFYPIYLDVKLIERKRKLMTNLSFMFSEISAITDKSSFDNYDTSNIKEMIYMFYNCKSKYLPNIANFKTHNATDMKHMFCNCSSVEKLPDISKWETKNVTDMSFMFNNCSALNELPNISEWDMENVIDTSCMFEQCTSITSLPDISIWKIGKIKYMNKMFRNCRNLSYLPNLSNWEINHDTETDNMFEGDKKLENLPRFKIKNNKLFKCCLVFNDKTNKVKYFIMVFYYSLGILSLIGGFLYYAINYLIIYNLDHTKECINNPIDYLNLLNKINITHIAKIKKIFNESKIEEMSSNKELTINRILNFTRINGNRKFDSDYEIYKISDLIIKHLFFFSLLFLIFIIINVIYSFKYLDSAKSIYLLLIICFLDILSIFLNFRFYKIVSKLSKSINKYFRIIKIYFQIEIPKINEEELDYLESPFNSVLFIIAVFLFSFITILILCKKIHNAREKNIYLINKKI